MDDEAPTNLSYKLSRSAGGLWEKLQVYWEKKWFRWSSYALGGMLVGYLLLWAVLLRNLPDAEALVE